MEVILRLGVGPGTVLKGLGIREVESHCCTKYEFSSALQQTSQRARPEGDQGKAPGTSQDRSTTYFPLQNRKEQ